MGSSGRSAPKFCHKPNEMIGSCSPLPPHRRPVNTMFQSYALFPHMTVEQNIAFGLKQDGLGKEAISKRVGEMLEQSEREIANIAPDSYIEDGYWTRICTQFNWGTRYSPPFCHSQDAINCVAVTLGKMGN